MDAGIIIAVIGAIEAVGVAIIGALVTRSNKLEAAREERDAYIYDLIFATASGTEVLLRKAHGEQVNGNVDDVLGQIKLAKAECNHVFNRQAAKI